MDNQKRIPDSNPSRDCEKEQHFLVMDIPFTDVFITVKPWIIFFECDDFDEIGNIPTYEANITYSAPRCQTPLITVSTLHVYDTPLLHPDQHLQEFLDGEKCCHNFINQDLSFLQPSEVYETTTLDDNQSTASDSSGTFITTVIENNLPSEIDDNSLLDSATVLPDEPENTDFSQIPVQPEEPAQIEPVEPVIRITDEEQRHREADPDLTINELLGLSAYEGHVNTPLQTFDGQYVN